jgi:hypothetical protein
LIDSKFYVYFYLRKDGTPYYVGKGSSNRAYRKHKTFRPPKDKSRIVFPERDLDEFEAFRLEKFWIEFYGRKDLGTGILHNKTNGGEGTSGVIRNEEWIEKQRLSHLGVKVWNKGKKLSEDQIKNMKKPKSTVINMCKPKPIVQCPHCGKKGGANNMPRYHFEKCKLK